MTNIIALIDSIWARMACGEFYSVNDLARSLAEPPEAVSRVLGFLSSYGFLEQFTRDELVFRKLSEYQSPKFAIELLRLVVS